MLMYDMRPHGDHAVEPFNTPTLRADELGSAWGARILGRSDGVGLVDGHRGVLRDEARRQAGLEGREDLPAGSDRGPPRRRAPTQHSGLDQTALVNS